MGQCVDVEAAGRYVGCDQQFGGAVAKSRHNPVALFLVHATVQRFGSVTAAIHGHGQFVYFVTGPTEDDGGLGCLDIENAAESAGLM